jgi:hypothetical protein
MKAALEAMRFSDNPHVAAFVKRYDAIPKRDRLSLRWEAIALAAGVDPVLLLGGAILAIQAYSANAVKIIALSHHPEVMKKRIEYARRFAGERDRSAIQTGLGFLPTVKGSTFIINPLSKPEEEPEPERDSDEERERDLNYLFPRLSETQEKLLPREPVCWNRGTKNRA